MAGDLEGAIEVFKKLQVEHPESPLGYLLEADALWWRIYYATANLIDPDVFTVPASSGTMHDAQFEALVEKAIALSEARLRGRRDVPRSLFYQGTAYALRGRLAALRDKSLPTARAGKKMRALLLEALQRDPSLTDAYLGIGTYNYFVDVLSPIVKLLRFFVGLPGGERAVGLQQLSLAAEKGELTKAEAKFYLAKIYARGNERQYEKSMQYFRELAEEYPMNPLWLMQIGSLYFRLGNRQQGEAIYWDVFRKTRGGGSEVLQAIHYAARSALQRLHPGRRIE